MAARALNHPRPARVRRSAGHPVEVNGEAVESLRESWLVEDRWWTAAPLRRRYWELVGERGRNLVVFHDLTGGGDAPGGWFVQSP
ncbi:MAG TPA: hypothetical protein VNZ01_01385 [Solirubrobacteraceae bacterium]|jgi:hypothetical protein|nr:hypothetical protein [Solirubrobacteraceae bacterium]